jgi:hypothetical protein
MRFPTLKQAISSTSATAPKSSTKVGRTERTRSWCIRIGAKTKENDA